MLYYYFKSKEKLFHQVIEHCYADLVASEEALDLDFSIPRKALADSGRVQLELLLGSPGAT